MELGNRYCPIRTQRDEGFMSLANRRLVLKDLHSESAPELLKNLSLFGRVMHL